MQQTCRRNKPIRHFSLRCIRTTPWRWKISQWLHKPTEPRLRCWRTISELSIQVATLTAKIATVQSENSRLKNREIIWPRPSTAIRRPATRPHQIRTRTKTEIFIQRAEKNSTLTGTDPLTATRWRKLTRPQLVASQRMATTN